MQMRKTEINRLFEGGLKMKHKIVEINGELYMTAGGVVLYKIERTE